MYVEKSMKTKKFYGQNKTPDALTSCVGVYVHPPNFPVATLNDKLPENIPIPLDSQLRTDEILTFNPLLVSDKKIPTSQN